MKICLEEGYDGGMKTREIEIQTADGICDAFVATPDESGTIPAVLLNMDGFGVRPYLKQMAERLASQGYYVLLPNLFYRVRRAPVLSVKFPVTPETQPEARKELMAVYPTYKPELGMRDAKAFLDFLAHEKQVRPGPVGIAGYCMGGGLAIRTAAAFPNRVAAVASFHAGGLVSPAPDSPHLLLSRIQAELYVAHADRDANMTAEQIEMFEKALESSGIRHETELYIGAMHGFTMADLPAFNADALERHWRKLLSFFDRNLKGK
jgi:carboxymethylenebutenolidase